MIPDTKSLAEFAAVVANEQLQAFTPFLQAFEIDVDAAKAMVALASSAARGLMQPRGIAPTRSATQGTVVRSALSLLHRQSPTAAQLHALSAACATTAILAPVECVQIASMLPAMLRVTDGDHEMLLGLADGKVPAGGVGALLSELGLVEGRRATRMGMAFGAALRLVEQIAPEFEVVRNRDRSG